MRTLGQDLRYACRLLARAPGFSVIAVVVLALGIGANSAIFSVVDAALLRPLPFREPGQLAMVWERPPGRPTNRVSPLNFQDWHDQNRVFSGLAAMGGNSPTLQTPSGPERIPGNAVTAEFFSVLGVSPILGRTFTADDERRQAALVVLGENLWRTHFSADPQIVGRWLTLGGKPFQVAGVLPSSFQFEVSADIWTLFTVERTPQQRRIHYLRVIGRLKPGITLQQAQPAMDAIAAHIAQISPGTNKGWGISMQPMREALVGHELRATSLLLASAVGLILLMACANIANLTLLRGAARAREMTVRVSLGAPSWRLVRQLITESLLLAGAGGIAGIGLAWALIRVAPVVIPEGTLPVGLRVELDLRIVAFTVVATLTAGLISGVVPAWRVTRSALATTLRGGRSVAPGRSKLLDGLAMAEIALGVVVVSGAGLFLMTLQRLGQVDPGFHATRILTMHMILPLSRYSATENREAFYQAAQQQVESVPGVQMASFGGSLPLNGFDIGQSFTVVGDPPRDSANAPSAHYQIVGARYFETLGIPLREGRPFDSRDNETAPQVAIVNQEFVRRYLAGRPALGTHIRISAMENAGPKTVDREIVGVVGQVRVTDLGESENVVEVYVPVLQNSWYSPSLAVRTAGEPLAMAKAVKAAIAKVDPELAVTEVRTMDEIAYQSMARPRFRARLLAGFGLLAMVLSAAGVFGVLAFSVAQRTREFGIRMALGARAPQVLRMVLVRGGVIAAGGIGAGLLGAVALGRSVATLLFDVRPVDPPVLIVAAVLLGCVAIGAAGVPAWRAARVDPAITLRDE